MMDIKLSSSGAYFNNIFYTSFNKDNASQIYLDQNGNVCVCKAFQDISHSNMALIVYICNEKIQEAEIISKNRESLKEIANICASNCWRK